MKYEKEKMSKGTFKSLLIFLIIIVVGFLAANRRINELEEKIDYLNHRVKVMEQKLNDQRTEYLDFSREFENFVSLTSDEFESTWVSLARVRNNFIALGKGFHLEDEDIAPDSEADPELFNQD